ncbi:MAG: TnsA endonuclease N-terminal domain-containing protein, partial [Pseudanabaena sp.]
YRISADLKDTVMRSSVTIPEQAEKSFHLDTYCFDSKPEQKLFWNLLKDGRVKKLYFTGMLTHGQSDFYIQYIDPDSHTVRSYYPDFLFQKNDDTYVIVEVKGDHEIDNPVVQAKKTFAEAIAGASKMTYRMLESSKANAGIHSMLFEDDLQAS